MLKTLPNFLSKEDFKPIQTYFFTKLSWFYTNSIAGENNDPDNFQFTHTFFNIRNPYLEIPLSSHSSILKPILLKLAPFYLYRVKANLRARTRTPVKGNIHTDFNIEQLTAIYYINTCNGYTEFEDGTIVNSVENTMLIFSGNLKHCGVSCTDQKRRIVLNINYKPGIDESGSPYFP
tara:strand:- start:575 stop:1105 length:531 start_codon:yes stop_codon:yes gene_type:complete